MVPMLIGWFLFLILLPSAWKVMVPDVFNGQRQIVQRAAVD